MPRDIIANVRCIISLTVQFESSIMSAILFCLFGSTQTLASQLNRSTPLVCMCSAICFKIMTRYTCGFLPRILPIFPALWVFFPKYVTIFFSNAHIYALQTSTCIWGHRKSSYYTVSKNPFMYGRAESNFSLNQALPQWPR